jgi:NAD(P)-dependent dehydrogenase (short-subunit alcohol dehydrogenase family)
MSDEHVVVVGGSSGLGRVVARQFIDRGASVTVLSRNPPAAWEGIAPRHRKVDLASLTDATAAEIAAHTSAAGGPIRYLVFCQRYRGTGDIWNGELQVSLTATDMLLRAFADRFCPDGDRAVAAVSSVYAEFVGGSQPASYHVAKAGMNALVRHNAWVMGRRGVRVNAIMPLTYLKAESESHYRANELLLDAYRRFVPLGRMGEAEECANVISFLCSAKASFVNGQCIFVDGGVSVVWPEESARGR